MRENNRNIWNCGTIMRIFASNNTCHASRKNSAPGRVFDFYRGELS